MNKRGFTLVEIAIVLVIVGLLLAAVLKGQELVTQGKVKGAIADFNGVLTAFNGYQDRYKAIPGDDSGAATRWPANAFGSNSVVAVNGNGDGIINQSTAGIAYSVNSTDAPSTTNAPEAGLFWQHLRAAGFYPGTQTGAGSVSLPNNSQGGTIGVENDTVSTAGIGMGGVLICMTSIPEKIASAVDKQIDDGSAISGSVRSLAATATTPNPNLTSAVPAAYAPGSSYVMCRSAT
jgi:prepilin-type N-terminal cleavage/methylation domain-containing protein